MCIKAQILDRFNKLQRTNKTNTIVTYEKNKYHLLKIYFLSMKELLSCFAAFVNFSRTPGNICHFIAIQLFLSSQLVVKRILKCYVHSG